MKNSTFLKDLFAIDKANDELFRLVGVAICMAIPLLIGYVYLLSAASFASIIAQTEYCWLFYCSGQQLRNAKSPCTLVDSHYNCHRRFSCTLTF